MANVKCGSCDGKGVVSRDGRATKTKIPYDLICHGCNGVGHYRTDRGNGLLAQHILTRQARAEALAEAYG